MKSFIVLAVGLLATALAVPFNSPSIASEEVSAAVNEQTTPPKSLSIPAVDGQVFHKTAWCARILELVKRGVSDVDPTTLASCYEMLSSSSTVSTPTVAAASPPKVAPSVASADSAQTSGTPSPLVSSFGESLNDIIHDPVAPRVRGAGPGTDLLVPQRDCNLWPPPLCVPQFEGRSEVIPRESDLSARLQESEDGRNCTLYPPPSCLPTRKSRSEEDPCCGLPEGTPNCFPKYYGRDVEKTNPQPKSAPVEEKRDVKPRIKIQLPAPDPIDALAAIERREPCCGNPDATPDCWPKFCERDAGAANPQLMPDSIDLLPARAPLDPGLETRGDCDKFPPNTVGCWPKTGSG